MAHNWLRPDWWGYQTRTRYWLEHYGFLVGGRRGATKSTVITDTDSSLSRRAPTASLQPVPFLFLFIIQSL